MLTLFPSAWLLLALPFVSSGVISVTPALRRAASAHSWITWPVGALGLLVLLAATTGLLTPDVAVPAAIAGGAVSGFSMFWPSSEEDGGDDGGDDWRRRRPPPDEPPPEPVGDGPVDWQQFDRLRAQWERPLVPGR